MRDGHWRDGGPLAGMLAGERLGLIGLGEIGSRVARIGNAFGMQVVAWSPHLTAERAAARQATAVRSTSCWRPRRWSACTWWRRPRHATC